MNVFQLSYETNDLPARHYVGQVVYKDFFEAKRNLVAQGYTEVNRVFYKPTTKSGRARRAYIGKLTII